MKTKHILTAMVLPAMFAACTADDIEGLNNVQQPERAVLSENFSLNFGGVESRLTAGEPDGAFDFKFEKNDVVGGAIVDAWDAVNEKFAVVNYVSTNHPFVNEGSKWTIEHTMVEGNYLFYYPYNPANNSRGAVVYEIPVMQDLSDAEGNFNRKAAIEKYSTAIALTELEKTDLSANVELKPINSYARIVAKFDNRYAGGEVEKVVLQATSKDGVQEYFTVKGQISNTKLELIEDAVLEGDKEWSEVKAASEYTIAEGESFYNDEITGRTSTVLVGKVPAGVKMKVDAQNNKSFETYMLVPAQTLTNAVKVYLYLTDGRVFVGATKSGITFNRHTPKKVEVEMDEAKEIPFVITSMKDWNLYASEVSKNTTAVFEIANPEFVLTSDAKFPTAAGATIKVTTDLTIAGDVTLKNVVATSKIIVAEDAKLTTDATLVAAAIENYGEVVVAPVKDEDGDYVAYNLGGYTYTEGSGNTATTNLVCASNLPKNKQNTAEKATSVITNMPGATLEIAENAIVETKIVNEIDEEVEEMTHGVVTVNGTVVLLADSENFGEVVNNGSMTGAFENNAEQGYYKNGTEGFKEEEEKIFFTPSITNNGEIFATAAWTNNGLISNAKGAEISVSEVAAGANFTNNRSGSIKLADGSFCLISTNAGEIVLSVLNQENWSANANTGVVAYTTGAADAGKTYDFTTTGKNITKIYLNGSLGVTKVGNVNDIEVVKDAVITMPAEGTIAKLTVKAGVAATIKSATVSNEVKTANFTNVTVEKGATLTVNEGHALKCAKVSNAGTIYVGGSFEATETLKGNAGTGKFKTTLTSANITFKSDNADAEAAEAAKVKVFTDFLQEFLDNSAAQHLSVGDHFATWADVTPAKIVSYTGSWASTERAEDFIEAYNAAFGLTDTNNSTEATTDDAKTAADFVSVIQATANKAYFEAGVAAVKAASLDNVSAAIKASIKDNTWFANDVVYSTSDEDYTINEVKYGATVMIEAFVAKVKTIACTNGNTKNNVVPGSVWLSLQDVTTERYWVTKNANGAALDADDCYAANTDEIPAYSYVELFEGSDLINAIEMWSDLDLASDPTVNTTPEWEKALNKVRANNKIDSDPTMKELAAFYNGIYGVYKKYEELQNDLIIGPKIKKAYEIAADVVAWEYTDKQIVAAVEAEEDL